MPSTWSSPDTPLWTCPECGRKFVIQNNWHSCSPYTVETFLAGKGPHARALFEKFESMVAACGPYTVSPAKTRVAFMGRVRFAGVSAISSKGLTIGFGLPYPVESPRIHRIENPIPSWYAHYMRVTSLDELDAELQAWLDRAYHLMGMQERLRGRTADA
jgi:hypothetical protein